MKIKYLGTGAAEGMPATFCACPVCLRSLAEGGKSMRMRSCALLDNDILIDMGPDIHAQKLRFGLRLDQLKAVVYTHSDADHQDLYALNNLGTVSCALHPSVAPEDDVIDLYGNACVYRRYMTALGQGQRMDAERFLFHPVKEWETFMSGKYTFHALPATHRPFAVEVCLIYAISDGKSAILYANDTGELGPEVDDYLKNTGLIFDVVSMDCARGLLPGDGHMGWAEVLRLRDRLKAIGAVRDNTSYILNHLSHMNNMTHSEWVNFAAPYDINVAWDGLEIEC